jgi:hypothetical protein
MRMNMIKVTKIIYKDDSKVIKVIYTKTNSNDSSVKGFHLRIIQHDQIIDHIFHFFERSNRQTKLLVPIIPLDSDVSAEK